MRTVFHAKPSGLFVSSICPILPWFWVSENLLEVLICSALGPLTFYWVGLTKNTKRSFWDLFWLFRPNSGLTKIMKNEKHNELILRRYWVNIGSNLSLFTLISGIYQFSAEANISCIWLFRDPPTLCKKNKNLTKWSQITNKKDILDPF